MPYDKDSGILDHSHNLPEMVKIIEAEWPVRPSGIWNGSSIESLRRHLRELSRRCELGGQKSLRRLTRLIEEKIHNIVDDGPPPNGDQITSLDETLERLKRATKNLQKPVIPGKSENQRFDLLLLQRNQDTRERIERALALREWRYCTLSNLQELQDALEGGTKAILADTSFLTELDRAPSDFYPRRHVRPGLFFVSDRCDIETRMQAIRAGAIKLFPEPIDLDALIKALEAYIQPKNEPRHRVLIVEDDESQARLVAGLLRKGGFETLTLTDPLGIIDTIWRFQPDLILMMDLYTSTADGLVLTTLIRDREESAAIPIVFLSAEVDPEKKLQALRAGADDFLTMPIQRNQLLTTVKSRISRAKTISAAGVHKKEEKPEQLPDRQALLSRLEQASRDHEEGGWLYGVIVIALDISHATPPAWRGTDTDQRIAGVVEGLGPLLQGKDFLARTGHSSLTILIRRHSQNEVERLAYLVYEIVNYRFSLFALPEKGFGIGLALLDSSFQSTEALLQEGESAANTAYNRGIKGFNCSSKGMLPGLGMVAEVETKWPKEQFLQALQPGSATLRERRFICRKGETQAVEIFELIPQSDLPGTSDNLYQMAAQCGAAAEFDRFVCDLGIQRLCEYTLKGKPVRLILRQSAAVMEESNYLDFIKAILRRLQIVGTGLIMEFELPSLASRLPKAHALFSELTALGIGISLSHFPCNESGYKVLTHLRADAVRPRPSVLRAGIESVKQISKEIRSLQTEIILPCVDHLGQISRHWWEFADYVPADCQTT